MPFSLKKKSRRQSQKAHVSKDQTKCELNVSMIGNYLTLIRSSLTLISANELESCAISSVICQAYLLELTYNNLNLSIMTEKLIQNILYKAYIQSILQNEVT